MTTTQRDVAVEKKLVLMFLKQTSPRFVLVATSNQRLLTIEVSPPLPGRRAKRSLTPSVGSWQPGRFVESTRGGMEKIVRTPEEIRYQNGWISIGIN